MRSAVGVLAVVALVSGCASSPRKADPAHRAAAAPKSAGPVRRAAARPTWPLPGDLLIADRNNNRILIVSPTGRVLWQDASLRGPDDAFFTPGDRSIITNQEFNATI